MFPRDHGAHGGAALIWGGPSPLPWALLGAGSPASCTHVPQEGAGWPLMGHPWGGLTHVSQMGLGGPSASWLWAGSWKGAGLWVWPLPTPRAQCVLGVF